MRLLVRCSLVEFGPSDNVTRPHPNHVTGFGYAKTCQKALENAEDDAKERWREYMHEHGVVGVRVKHCPR